MRAAGRPNIAAENALHCPPFSNCLTPAEALEKFCLKVDQRDLRSVGFWVIAFLHCGRSNLGPVLAYEKYAPGVVKKGLTRRLS
jgi:hypothetical protein